MFRFRIWDGKLLTSLSSATVFISPPDKHRSSVTIRLLRILLHSCVTTALFSTPGFRLLPRCNSGSTSSEIIFLGLLPLEDGPIGCPEASFNNYQHMLCNFWRPWVRASQIYSSIYPTRCNFTQCIYFWKLLYMFRVSLPPIIRSAYNCIYSIWYLSDRSCYLPLLRQVAVAISTHPWHQPAATWVNTTRYGKYSQVLLIMGENIARKM
jgi:hypothetical protein